MKNKAYALNIGLKCLNPAYYNGEKWEEGVKSCEKDARAMQAIAESLDYEKIHLLLTKKATKSDFFCAIADIQNRIKPGDLFFISFSGHGGQVPDKNGDEKDKLDEIWCLYDGLILDDEMTRILQDFEKGVHILVISDSCYSGETIEKKGGTRMWGQTKRIELAGVKASVRLIASTQEYECALGGSHHGLFTAALLKVWNHGKFVGNYQDFYSKILSHISTTNNQIPNQVLAGGVDEWLEEGRPFLV